MKKAIVSQIEESWNLEDIYIDSESIEMDIVKLSDIIVTISKYKNNINNAESLYDYCMLREKFQVFYKKLYIYAMLQVDLDTREQSSHLLLDRVKQFGYKFSKEDYFFAPYLMSLEKSVLEKYILEKPDLNYFKSDLLNLHRYGNHFLGLEQEQVISKLQESLSSPQNLFSTLYNTDIQFGTIKNDQGENIQLTRTLYNNYLKNMDQNKRKEVYSAYNKPFIELKNTLAINLATSIKNNVLISQLRNYPSTIEQFLYPDEIPLTIYNNMIEITKSNKKVLHKYLQLRKKFFDLDKLNAFDLNIPIAKADLMNDIPFDQSFNHLIEAFKPLGPEYLDVFKTFKDKRYIDVREKPGKRPGAYSIGLNGVHPFILLNYRNDFNSVITFAHESGHAMHSYFSSKYQPTISSNYSELVAEIASTVNEVLLLRYLLDILKDNEERAYILNSFIDRFIIIFINQVMLAEFEKEIYCLAESDSILNSTVFDLTYEKIFKNYYGDEVNIDDGVKSGWSRIPHFYRPFYVYKYAIGFAAAIDIADRIQSNNKTLESYLCFLKSGSSNTPLELLNNIGIDFSEETTIKKALSFFEELINKLSLTITDKS